MDFAKECEKFKVELDNFFHAHHEQIEFIDFFKGPLSFGGCDNSALMRPKFLPEYAFLLHYDHRMWPNTATSIWVHGWSHASLKPQCMCCVMKRGEDKSLKAEQITYAQSLVEASQRHGVKTLLLRRHQWFPRAILQKSPGMETMEAMEFTKIMEAEDVPPDVRKHIKIYHRQD